MGDFFANLRSGVQFPQVVMNQGPLPGMGGLPRPLHDTADGRINYNSALLGNLSPYAYGEPGYLSSQTAYLNIPHKIQKIVPQVYLPDAHSLHNDIIGLSHPVDDGDLAFTLRLDRNSLFCTGSRTSTRRMATGTAIDPLINLATVNYILAGLQLIMFTPSDPTTLWRELLQNLDPCRFGEIVRAEKCMVSLDDIVHIVKNCIRPLGIVRGSEKQGGQNEATQSPATWPVCFVASVTLDGKESNVMNLWHHLDFSAGEDLVLCLKLMPIRPYTLNHYYKGVQTQTFTDYSRILDAIGSKDDYFVWQLCPNVMSLAPPSEEEMAVTAARLLCFDTPALQCLKTFTYGKRGPIMVTGATPWQDLGYWHIGRTQIMSGKYGVEEYWHNDNANGLRTNHLDITLQPTYCAPPKIKSTVMFRAFIPFESGGSGGRRRRGPRVGESAEDERAPAGWEPTLLLERLEPAAPQPHDHCDDLCNRPSAVAWGPAPPQPYDPCDDLCNRPRAVAWGPAPPQPYDPCDDICSRPSAVAWGPAPPQPYDDGGDWFDNLGFTGSRHLPPPPRPTESIAAAMPVKEGREEDLGVLEFLFEDEAAEGRGGTDGGDGGGRLAGMAPPPLKKARGGRAGSTKRPASGSLLRADGSSESGVSVGML